VKFDLEQNKKLQLRSGERTPVEVSEILEVAKQVLEVVKGQDEHLRRLRPEGRSANHVVAPDRGGGSSAAPDATELRSSYPGLIPVDVLVPTSDLTGIRRSSDNRSMDDRYVRL
jgi:hypothetical protein